MRLVTYEAGGDGLRLGAVVNDQVLDLPRAAEGGGSSLPTTMFELVAAGPAAWNRAKQLVSDAGSQGGSLSSDSARRLS